MLLQRSVRVPQCTAVRRIRVLSLLATALATLLCSGCNAGLQSPEQVRRFFWCRILSLSLSHLVSSAAAAAVSVAGMVFFKQLCAEVVQSGGR